MRQRLPYFTILLFLFIRFQGFAQDSTKIILEYADSWEYDKALGENTQRIIGNVRLRHDSTLMFCDSAHYDDYTNFVKAYGHVHIQVSDTLNIFGDTLFYNGNTKIARMMSHVKLIDNETILTTDTLLYDRVTRIAQYHTGATITNEKNRLTSIHGYYYTDQKLFYFHQKVVVTNPDNVMRSDTLRYNTVSRIAYFFGPSTITGKDDFIYCENGWHNTKLDISRFSKHAYVTHKDQTLFGDSLYYDQKNGFGEAFRNVHLVDTVQDVVVTGEYGRYVKKKGYSFVTQHAMAIYIDNKDSLFMHADTLKATFDTSQTMKEIRAYYKAKFYRKDLQGMSDSMVYVAKDSILWLYKSPVLWTEKNQLTSDSISISIHNNEADSLVLYNAAFIISKDDTNYFNQIKGKLMIGYFHHNDLRKIKVFGNAETIYFVREEDKSLIGVNKAISSDMLIFLRDNDMRTITYIGKPDATMYPLKDLTPYDLRLRDFNWNEDRRPMKKEDIFIW